MPTRIFETVLDAPVQKVWEFHSSAKALKILTPPGRKISVVGENLEVVNGALHELRLVQFGLPMVWRARISEVEPPNKFVDTAEKSPFKVWRHVHEFIAQREKTLLKDTVTYELPFGFLGSMAAKLFVDRDIEKMFAYRHEATKRSLETSFS